MAEPTLALQQAQYLHDRDTDRLGFLRNRPSWDRDGIDLDTGRISMRVDMEFGKWEEPEELADDEDLRAVRALHQRARERFGEILETIKQVSSDDDPSLNAAGRLKIAAKVIEPKLLHLADVAKREVARVDEAIASEHEQIDRAMKPGDPSDIAVQGDIRRHWQTMSAEARTSRAILTKDMDTTTLQALATGPAYLSGLSDTLQARIRAELARRVAPERVKRAEALTVGKARAIQALTALDRRANRLIDFRKARALIEREAKRNAQD